MSRKERLFLYIVRGILLALCIFTTGFITYNSIQSGEDSAAQSSRVVSAVQEVAKWIAPDSKVATATGEDYDMLHSAIRTLAHVTEFLLLGFSAFGACLSFTRKKHALAFPAVYVVSVACLDELLQTFISGRAGEFSDVVADMVGSFVGGLLACVLATLIIYLYRKREEKKNEAGQLGNSADSIQ